MTSVNSPPQQPTVSDRLWFIRRADSIKGPFPTDTVRRNLQLGRLRGSDEVSRDRVLWVALADESEFRPQAVAAGLGPPPAGIDERTGRDRRAGQPEADTSSERRRAADRRRPEAPEIVARRQRRLRIAATLVPARNASTALPILVLVALALGLIALVVRFRPAAVVTAACDAAPAPGINWSGCMLSGRDLSTLPLAGATLTNAKLANANLFRADLSRAELSYADLSAARLGYSGLSGARMRGATLRDADLEYADLHGADLSYADLRQAKLGAAILTDAVLDNAMWIDARICAPGSRGVCR